MGLEFEYNKFLDIIDNQLENYIWVIKEAEVYEKDKQCYPNRVLTGTKLRSLLKQNVIFLNLQGYKDIRKASQIETYDDFKKSECMIIILISDCIDIEIYFKNSLQKELLVKNLNKYSVEFEIKSKENDCRKFLHF